MAEEKKEISLEEKAGWAFGAIRAWFKNVKRAGLINQNKENKIASAITILREYLKEKGVLAEQKEEGEEK